jgi:CRP-like cAMP-binding protein
MTDSVVDLAARDPETFRRLLREDPAFQERVLDEFMRLYRSDPDFRRAADAILWAPDEVRGTSSGTRIGSGGSESRPRRGLPTLKEFLGR